MAPPAVARYDDRERRRVRSAGILRDGIILGLLIIAVSLWLGTSSGSSTASAGLTWLGVGDATVGLLVLAVVVIVLFSAFLGLRDRVIARIGLRNVTRAKSRTVILLFGLLIGSMIISSSLVIGDTVDTLSVHFTYISDGAVDESVWAPLSASTGGLSPFSYNLLPASLYGAFNQSAMQLPDVAGVTPMLLGDAGVFDRTTNVAQPGLRLVGVDASASRVLGSFTTTSGATLPGPTPGEVLLNPTAAQELSASPGDALNLTAGEAGVTLHVHVLALVQADDRGGFQDQGQGDIFTTLGDAQNLTSAIDFVNYIAVTNVGGLTGGPSHTTTVLPQLQASLTTAERATGQLSSGASVNNVLGNDLTNAEQSASSLTQLFLVLGLFSIGAGCVLIVGIFAMLAEERRGEMGVARAIGTRRGQLVRAYYFEGMAYSAGAALLGTLLGVVVGWGIIQGFAQLFGSGGGTEAQAVAQSFTWTPQSLIIAYSAGFLLTLGTVTLTSAYVSRMNIVRAMRGQPELLQAERSRRVLLVLGAVLALVGLLVFQAGRASGTDIDIGYFGVSLTILAVGMALAFFVPHRYAFSAAALGLLVFWADLSLRTSLFPGPHTGTIYVFFQEGVFLILAAVILYVFNSDLIVRLFATLSRRSSRNLPVVRLAFSYPSHRRFRSAMTISIFAMVLFTISGIAVIGNGITSGVESTIQAQSGGYTFFGESPTGIPNASLDVQANHTLFSDVSSFIPFYSGGGEVQTPNERLLGPAQTFEYGWAAAPTGVPAWENFYASNRFNFSSTWNGMSPAQIWADMQEPNSTYAVLDGSFTASIFGNFGGAPSHPPVQVGEQLNLSTSPTNVVQVTVLGVLSEQTIPIILLNPQVMAGHFGFTQTAFFFLSPAPGISPTKVLQDFQTHFFSYELQLFDFTQILASTLGFTNAFIDLLEVFVALGLVVGITALGILALRAVTERRTQIGVVRAIGFRKSQVLASFLTEYSFLALMGIGIGAVMGLVLAYNLYQALGGVFAFSIPWENMGIVLITSYGLTLVATGIPSLRASRIPPAEAIRYSE